MRNSGWAAAAGLGSLVLLLTACGGSSSTSGSTPASRPAQAAGQPTSGTTLPQPGSTVLMVQKSAIGYLLAVANGQVVYTYAGDSKGGTPACTSSCAAIWLPVTGKPVASAADVGLGKLGTVSDANGASQITYDGMPLYMFKGAKPLATSGNGADGMWHVVKLSKTNVVGG